MENYIEPLHDLPKRNQTGEQDKTNSSPMPEVLPEDPGEYLAERYNINDQAHLKSSPEDFVRTISGFRHADGSVR